MSKRGFPVQSFTSGNILLKIAGVALVRTIPSLNDLVQREFQSI